MAFMRGFLCDQQLLLCKASKHLILSTDTQLPLYYIKKIIDIYRYMHTYIATIRD